MIRFRPTVEALGDRALPSAVLAGYAGPTVAPVSPTTEEMRLTDQPSEPTTESFLSLNYTKITYQTAPQR
jgi:hypothetical protein